MELQERKEIIWSGDFSIIQTIGFRDELGKLGEVSEIAYLFVQVSKLVKIIGK